MITWSLLGLAATQELLMKAENRFWPKVNIGSLGECWEWKAQIKKTGYGAFRFGKTKVGAHRMAYFLMTGDDADNMLICHSCDNKICCNPMHLWKGSYLDNNRDRRDKGRSRPPIGERNGGAKLSRDQVSQIREMYSTGEYYQKELAELFNVSVSTATGVTATIVTTSAKIFGATRDASKGMKSADNLLRKKYRAPAIMIT